MKKQLLLLLFVAGSFAGMAQTATDFTANDCSGTSHNLFTELNTGKVIVLVWVMPCSNCVSASLTTYNVVQSYQALNPNRVYMYLCDDYANTACASLSSWANTYGLTNTVRFSDASINMLDYVSAGMPKIVVLGGDTSHTVFYNANTTVNATDLQNAINSALLSTGIREPGQTVSSLNVFPNPATNPAEIRFTLKKPAAVTLELFNLEGQLVKNVYSGKLSAGENRIPLDVAVLSKGTYLLKCSEGMDSRFVNVVVSH